MKLRVWHNPQIGTRANFYIPVESPEEGYKVMQILDTYEGLIAVEGDYK